MRKRVLLGVTGGIAAYKAAQLTSALVSSSLDVVVIMTDSATEFVTPLTFETLSKNRVITDMFSREFPYEVKHISLAKSSDLVLIAPATANFIGKIANGIADDMLTTTYMASKAIKVICPAMNDGMYSDEAFRRNMDKLHTLGALFVEPECGRLACGDEGKGRLASPEKILSFVLELLNIKPDYLGKRVLVTAGATAESIDGIRFLSNRSSGKMGIALADAAYLRGAAVTLVAARTTAPIPEYINTIRVETTNEMYQAVLSRVPDNDIIIKAAAPADYMPESTAANKLKDEKLTLNLIKTKDIAKAVGQIKGDKKLVVFCAETELLVENAKQKLAAKNADMIVANDVTKQGAGFDTDTNIVTIIRTGGAPEESKLMLKTELADIILDKILEL